MAPLCGVCERNESKYKCSLCELRYCSITCYKSHKSAHDNGTLPAASQPSSSAALASILTPISSAPRSTVDPSTNPQSLPTNPQLTSLLTTNPTLLSTLQSIYALTIPPPPSDPSDPSIDSSQPSHHHSYRGRGRGRGRGYNRGRGGYANDRPRQWTEAGAERKALRMLRELREGGDEAVEEFVRLIGEIKGIGVGKENGRREEEGRDVVMDGMG